ncbi:MAG: tetratricopeptide repeat protein [Aliivibrio sp.]|uniref:tetratricopeptide repeat protein n=1 Tax=Aliivibrio sp. TaxID=1872443 RepID=UPI001A5425E5|nr:tetratricopeptide repeat protein [Aliivibrio sp.]
MNKTTIISTLIIVLVGCSSQNSTIQVKQKQSSPENLLDKAALSVEINQPQLAMDHYIAPLIKHCTTELNIENTKVFSARTDNERKYYKDFSLNNNLDVKIIDGICSNTYFFASYAQSDLNNIKAAESYILKGLDISPVNSKLLSELGHVYQIQKKWDKSISYFEKAQEYSSLYSPQSTAKQEQSRAMRGIGFSLIEMGQLEKAKDKFNKALTFNPLDTQAKQELQYIEQLITKNK